MFSWMDGSGRERERGCVARRKILGLTRRGRWARTVLYFCVDGVNEVLILQKGAAGILPS